MESASRLARMETTPRTGKYDDVFKKKCLKQGFFLVSSWSVMVRYQAFRGKNVLTSRSGSDNQDVK